MPAIEPIVRDAVLCLARQGWTTDRIRRALCISPRTVQRIRAEVTGDTVRRASEFQSLDRLLADGD